MGPEKELILMKVSSRMDQSPHIQQVLKEWGSIIRTRIGMHDPVSSGMDESCVIIIDIIRGSKGQGNLAAQLNAIPGVSAKLVTF